MGTRADRRTFRQTQRLTRRANRVSALKPSPDELIPGGGEKQYGRAVSRYDRLFSKLSNKNPAATQGFTPFDFETGDFAEPPPNPYAKGGAAGGPQVGGQGAPGQTQPTPEPGSVEDVTASPFGPGFDQILKDLAQGFPAGIDINTEKGARAIETLFPLIQHAYNAQMQEEGIGTAAKSVDEYKNDPLLQGVASGMTDKLTNPYTFDDQTVQLMQNRVAEDMANQEASMGERLRSMGADVGMDPSSPRYASAAAQAVMMRDINQTKLQRDLDIDMARQRQADEYQALGAAGQFGGAYQSGLGQRYAGLTGAQLGGKFQNVGNPFAGLWEGLLMENELDKDPSFMDQYGPTIGAGLGAAGRIFAPTPGGTTTPTK